MKPSVYLLLASLLGIVGIGHAADEIESLGPEQYLELAEQERLKVVDFIEKSGVGGRSEYKFTDAEQASMTQVTQRFERYVDKAADLGYPPALYLQANRLFNQSGTGSREASCASLAKARGQGFLAVEVAYFKRCNPANRTWNFEGEASTQLASELEQELSRPERFADRYPVYLPDTSCFRGDLPPDPRSMTLSEYFESKRRQVLSYDQFRAEVANILVMIPTRERKKPDARSLEYFDQAQALGCKVWDTRESLQAAITRAAGEPER